MPDARLHEEAEAKWKLAELEDLGVDHPEFGPKFAAFRDAVLEHAEQEEGKVFPILRETQNQERLQRMTTAVKVAERLAPTHPHPHGPTSAVGNLLVGPFVAIADKVRDAMRSTDK